MLRGHLCKASFFQISLKFRSAISIFQVIMNWRCDGHIDKISTVSSADLTPSFLLHVQMFLKKTGEILRKLAHYIANKIFTL